MTSCQLSIQISFAFFRRAKLFSSNSIRHDEFHRHADHFTGGIRNPSWQISRQVPIEPGMFRQCRHGAHAQPRKKSGSPSSSQSRERVSDKHRRYNRNVRQMRPARNGSFSIAISPDPSCSASIAARTDIGIEPRCTGMWSPIASTSPAALKTAQE